jgi:F-type H+-transporting ATPase subunit delta
MTVKLKALVEESSPNVSERRLAKVYAGAVLNAAQKENAQEIVLEELVSLINDVSRRDPDIASFFTSGVVGKVSREAALKHAFTERCHPIVLQSLLVLNSHDRVMLLRTVVEEVQALYDARARRFPVQVRAAVPLADDERQRLFDNLRQTFHLEPVLDVQIDPALLGGVVIRVADWVFDGSVRTQLVIMRKQLLENASHEIQSGRDRLSPAT